MTNYLFIFHLYLRQYNYYIRYEMGFLFAKSRGIESYFTTTLQTNKQTNKQTYDVFFYLFAYLKIRVFWCVWDTLGNGHVEGAIPLFWSIQRFITENYLFSYLYWSLNQALSTKSSDDSICSPFLAWFHPLFIGFKLENVCFLFDNCNR